MENVYYYSTSYLNHANPVEMPCFRRESRLDHVNHTGNALTTLRMPIISLMF